MIYAVNDISGAHFNPAVTLALLTSKKISIDKAIWYFIAQIIGSVAASFTHVAIFGIEDTKYSIPRPAEGLGHVETILLETLLTFFLVFIIINMCS